MKLKKSATKISHILTDAYGDKTLMHMCLNGIRAFSGGKVSVEDDEPAGRPRKPNLPKLKRFRKNGKSPKGTSGNLVPEAGNGSTKCRGV
ncbi:hypothetical protein TNCV_267281 [Trichonephila clavipes]|nr:hypothetical protein TNCV_267281 [Trichonephila clavipes]